MEIDISAIISEWDKKYINQGQTARDIKKMLFHDDDISQYFRTIPHQNSHYRSAYATIDAVLQAFAIPFTNKSTTTFKPHEQRLGEFKIDTKIVPDELWPSWLGFLAQLEKVDRSKWIFIQWAITELLIPKAQEDFLQDVAYWGWQYSGIDAAPTVDGATFERELTSNTVALPANASMDGIKKQIAKFVAGERIDPIAAGAWSMDPVTFCEQIEAWVLEIPKPLRKKLDFLFMRDELRNRYRDGRREKYNMYYAQEADLDLIDKTKIRVKETESMEGSDQIWSTPAMNRVKPTKVNMKNRFDVQKVDREVKLLNNWAYVLTFDVPEFIVTSEHETTISAQNIVDHYTE